MFPVAMVCSAVAMQITVVAVAHLVAHGVLGGVNVAVHGGQRAVVPDGPRQHVGHALLSPGRGGCRPGCALPAEKSGMEPQARTRLMVSRWL